METTLDRFGRVVIPKQVRDDLGLASGSVLKIEEQAEGIVLKPVVESSPLVVKDGILVFTGEIEGDLETALQAVRRDRTRGSTLGQTSRRAIFRS